MLFYGVTLLQELHLKMVEFSSCLITFTILSHFQSIISEYLLRIIKMCYYEHAVSETVSALIGKKRGGGVHSVCPNT
jgi:uncharacterized membrane protein